MTVAHDLRAHVLGGYAEVQVLIPVINSKLFVIVFLRERQREFYALVFEVQFKGSVGWGRFVSVRKFGISFKESNQESTHWSTVHPSIHPPMSAFTNSYAVPDAVFSRWDYDGKAEYYITHHRPAAARQSPVFQASL